VLISCELYIGAGRRAALKREGYTLGPAAQQNGLAGWTKGRAGGLHIEAGCTKGRAAQQNGLAGCTKEQRWVDCEIFQSESCPDP